ncbi:hypothetical protein COLU111180_11615 [Cohnella lubricantis]|uniref:Uncharacterized protein n=1 Tax=Cohnella lubricantis TaxID=2163172 RepID=A0A841TCJ1_9BACL|nr:hypothetical protein [Cohnella lubricantis]MBB6676171.1 hypothetical protein [Cohnella lubricantis]MBP2118636.1 hypothetical protein [Cohnella lubricantis]
MIKYGDDQFTELKFVSFEPRVERRNEHWVDVYLKFETDPAPPAPTDLIELTALVVCTPAGAPIEIEPLDEGCDCEYQFTFSEKEQIKAYIGSDRMQQSISSLCCD